MPASDQLALLQRSDATTTATAQRRTGRPRGPDVYMTTSVRLTVEERQMLNALADSAGMTYSEVLRAGLSTLAARSGGDATTG